MPPFGRKKILCCIRDCGRKATQSAGVSTGPDMGRIRPLCDNPECLEKMKKAEQTDKITLTPIEDSVFA